MAIDFMPPFVAFLHSMPAADGFCVYLGFDESGEPVEIPDGAVGWRVRRCTDSLKGGAPSLVYSKEGPPLIVPLGATVEDLRREVGAGHPNAPGKYRLDFVGQDGRSIRGAPACYVMLGRARTSVVAPGEGGSAASLLDGGTDAPLDRLLGFVGQLVDLIRDQHDSNAQTARVALEQASKVIDATANVLSRLDQAAAAAATAAAAGAQPQAPQPPAEPGPDPTVQLVEHVAPLIKPFADSIAPIAGNALSAVLAKYAMRQASDEATKVRILDPAGRPVNGVQH